MTGPCPQIVVTRPGLAEFRLAPPIDNAGGDAIIETEYSIVSAGTELAVRDGLMPWAALPFVPGYGSVGRIVAGPDAGQRVFTYGRHAKFSPAKTVSVPLPEGMDPVAATFARIAAVSITALRVADAVLGDTVAVFGLGLVGNLAAQLFSLAGCEVVGIDVSTRRRERAAACGIEHVFAPGDDLPERVRALTGGRMCRSVVEASGVPAVAVGAGALASRGGEVILLGGVRGRFEADLARFLERTYSWSLGCVSIKGAAEWRYPAREDREGFARFSVEGNVRAILRLIASGRLRTGPLLTHVVSPADCQSVYDGLRDEKDTYLGVVFDWSKV